MVNGQLLIRGASADTSVYSPWFPRQGDYIRITAELIAGDGKLTVTVFTKSAETTTDGSAATGTAISIEGTPANETQEFSGINEMVRYKITCGDASGEWILFRILPPVWFDAVEA